MDNYPRIAGNANGKLSPEVSKKISSTFKNGALVFNYIGHGGTSNLSDEKILTRDDIGHWQNLDNMPLMVTATCEFGRYDNPGELSGAEVALLNPNGGAIALLTTTRPVYAITNKKINEAFYNAAFQPINGQMPRLGDILRPTKNNSFEQVYNRNFTLLGDPSMKLAYPYHKIKLVRKNGQTITEKNDTLRALENVNFEGEIRDFRDEFLLKNFNGKVNIKVYDKETTLQTLGNNANSKMNYRVFQDKIFETEASVENGKFKINFTVPKDIQYKYGSGRIEMYAENAEKTMDALAVHNKIIIGGSQNIPEKDQNPPQILAYLDREDFVNGSKTGPNPILIATIADDKGLNINTAATGHEITAKLDGKTIFILNENIRPILDKPNHYHISYPLINLAPGNHSLEVTAWDIYNNSFSKTLEFTVVLNDLEQLTKVFNFPNPITDHTQIHFEHNFIGENLKNEVSIF